MIKVSMIALKMQIENPYENKIASKMVIMRFKECWVVYDKGEF